MHPKQPQSISTTTPVYQRRIGSTFCKFEKPTAQTKLRGKSKEGGRSPLLGRFKGIAKGQGSHANPAKRFVWEKEEQRNGRRLSAASGGQDEGCGVCSDATPPLPFSFYRQRLFLCRAKKKGLNTALSEAFRKKLRHSGAKKARCVRSGPKRKNQRRIPQHSRTSVSLLLSVKRRLSVFSAASGIRKRSRLHVSPSLLTPEPVSTGVRA